MERVGPDPYVLAEAGTAAAWPAFEEAGFRVAVGPDASDWVGHAQLLIVSAAGELSAAADPRADGEAAAL
jgi:gamma-glutamyltranspeptidase